MMIAIETIVRFQGKGWVLSVEDRYYPRLVLRQGHGEDKLNWSVTPDMFSIDLPEDLLRVIIDNAAEIQKALISNPPVYSRGYIGPIKRCEFKNPCNEIIGDPK